MAAVFALAAVIVVIALSLLVRRRRRLVSSRVDTSKKEGGGLPLPRGKHLRAALATTRHALRERIAMKGRDPHGDEYFAGVEEALVVADVGVRTAQRLLTRLRKGVGPQSTRDDVTGILAELLVDILAEPKAPAAEPSGDGLRVVLVVGVNGVGKTTTIGKLAARYVSDGLRVLLVAADTFRAAAGEQLERWAARVGADMLRQQPGADPAAVVVDGLRAARTRRSDVVIIDTAGRLHTKRNLMEELSKVRRVAARECPGAPHETLLVLDATTGQNGLQQARIFKELLEVTGIVLTKMDGTARGGVAIAVAAELGIPIRFVGLGEGPQDLEPFEAEAFVDALLKLEADGPGNKSN